MLLHLEVYNVLHPSDPGRPLDRLSKKLGYLVPTSNSEDLW